MVGGKKIKNLMVQGKNEFQLSGAKLKFEGKDIFFYGGRIILNKGENMLLHFVEKKSFYFFWNKTIDFI